MRVELSALPAIHLGGECVVPGRRVWDVVATRQELEGLARVAEALTNDPDQFPLDRQAVRALTSTIEAMQVVARREDG